MNTVCIVANSPFSVLNFRSELMRTLIERGSAVYVICPLACALMGARCAKSEFFSLGVNFIQVDFDRVGTNLFNDGRLVLDLFRAFRVIKPDVVMNFTVKASIYGSFSARWAGVPMISSNITGLGFVFTGRSLRARTVAFVVRSLYRLAFRCNSIVFFQNPDDRRLFVKLHLVDFKSTKVINGSGVDTDYFKPMASSDEGISFLFVGRLLQSKGVLDLLEAAVIVKSIRPDVEINIIGHFDTNPSGLSKSFFSTYEEKGYINFLGGSDNIKQCYQENTIFVLPSYREGTPRSTLEAMSMGMPIITTNVPGCRETVVNEVNGFLVKSADPEALARAMILMVEDIDRMISMGLESRKIAVKRYDVNLVNDSIICELFP